MMMSFLQHHYITTLATGHGNFVPVVELSFLTENLISSLNGAVWVGFLDVYSSSGNSTMLILSQNYFSNQENPKLVS